MCSFPHLPLTTGMPSLLDTFTEEDKKFWCQCEGGFDILADDQHNAWLEFHGLTKSGTLLIDLGDDLDLVDSLLGLANLGRCTIILILSGMCVHHFF